MLQSRYLDLDPNFPAYDPNRPIDWNNPNDPNRGKLDQNGDGLIDWWQREQGLDATAPNGGQAAADPDYDGLTNGDEFTYGTQPLSSDSDQGGQNDGSELTGGGNPLDPSDDQTTCPRYFKAGSTLQSQDEPLYTGAVILTYEVVPDHKSFSLWRQVEGGTREFVTDQLPATGVYSDTAVSVGTTYRYWIWANDAEGNASCVLGPAAVTLDANAPAPEGVVRINNGAARTTTPKVKLQINATPDAIEMQVANSVSALYAARDWEPYAPTKNWTLAPAAGVGTVFVRFRDSSGNRSEPSAASIQISAGTKLYLPQVSRH